MQLIINFDSIRELQMQVQQFLSNENKQEELICKKEPNRKPKRLTDFEINEVTHWYSEKTFTAKEMARTLGRTPSAVGQLIHKLTQKGLPLRSHRAGKVIEE